VWRKSEDAAAQRNWPSDRWDGGGGGTKSTTTRRPDRTRLNRSHQARQRCPGRRYHNDTNYERSATAAADGRARAAPRSAAHGRPLMRVGRHVDRCLMIQAININRIAASNNNPAQLVGLER